MKSKTPTEAAYIEYKKGIELRKQVVSGSSRATFDLKGTGIKGNATFLVVELNWNSYLFQWNCSAVATTWTDRSMKTLANVEELYLALTANGTSVTPVVLREASYAQASCSGGPGVVDSANAKAITKGPRMVAEVNKD